MTARSYSAFLRARSLCVKHTAMSHATPLNPGRASGKIVKIFTTQRRLRRPRSRDACIAWQNLPTKRDWPIWDWDIAVLVLPPDGLVAGAVSERIRRRSHRRGSFLYSSAARRIKKGRVPRYDDPRLD